jgi:predicted SprT family Zn-dependent metalloprotease
VGAEFYPRCPCGKRGRIPVRHHPKQKPIMMCRECVKKLEATTK